MTFKKRNSTMEGMENRKGWRTKKKGGFEREEKRPNRRRKLGGEIQQLEPPLRSGVGLFGKEKRRRPRVTNGREGVEFALAKEKWPFWRKESRKGVT